MDFQPQPKGNLFTTLQIIHGALCLGPTLFAVVSYSITPNTHSDIRPNDSVLLYVAAFMALSMVFVSNFLFNKQLAVIDFTAPVKQRLLQYQTACIVRYALLEGAALFNVVVFLLTGNYISLAIGAAMIVFMVTIRPTRPVVTEALKISYPDTLD
jgi:DMSO reductase anchor subunit